MLQYFLPHVLGGGNGGAVLGDCGGCGAKGRGVKKNCYKNVTRFCSVKCSLVFILYLDFFSSVEIVWDVL